VRLRALSLTAIVLAIIFASAAVQAAAIGLPNAAVDDLENKARALIDVARRAEERVISLVEMVEGNETIIGAINETGLYESYLRAKSLIDKGSSLLKNAEESFSSKNYDSAIQAAIEAMRLFRSAYTEIHRILCKAGVTPIEEAPELKAQGLLVAVNRSLERIKRIRLMLNATDDMLSDAERLLNEIEPLLRQGNVSEAAHKLAEANKLISEAFVQLRRRAENMTQTRAEKFVLNFGRIRSEIAKRVREEGLNATEILGQLGLENLDEISENLSDIIKKMEPKKIKDVIKNITEDLRDICDLLREARRIVSEKMKRAKIGDILANASAFKGELVIVTGNCCGQSAPKSLPGPSGKPPEDSWWILADESGWIYIVRDGRMGIARRPIILEGARVTVVGRVIVEGDTIYIREMLLTPLGPIIVPTPPIMPVAPSDVLKVSANVEKNGKDYKLSVTIENVGNEPIVFPNTAYGMMIEKKTAKVWLPIPRYTPISAQILVTLNPGESRTITVTLKQPSPGAYRVVVTGWLEKSRTPVTASAEFTIP